MKPQDNSPKRAARVRLFTAAIFLVMAVALLLVMPFQTYESSHDSQDTVSAGVWFVLLLVWVLILVQNLRTGQREAALLSGGAILIFAGIVVRSMASFLPAAQYTLVRVSIAVLLVAAIGVIGAYMVRQALQTRHST
jgi:ABC-type sugar transport system permease subunit